MNSPKHHNALPANHEVNWYRIDEVLGQGSFGITYLAHDRNLDTAIALKEYFPSAWAVRLPDGAVAAAGPAYADEFKWGLERFVSEGRILVRFDHPSLVRVMSVFEANDTAYIVMRFERGVAFHEVLAHTEALAEDDVKVFLRPLLDGLRVMHAAGVIHRDIKPDNIFIRSDGSPLLLDFGAARKATGSAVQELTSIGTAGYAPVEQYSDDEGRQGPWTDIYALGATVYHALAGRAPKDALARANAIINGSADPLAPLSGQARGKFSREFLRAVERAMSVRSEDRPQDVEAFASDLGITLGPGAAADPSARTEVLPRSKGGGAASMTEAHLVDTGKWEIDGLDREVANSEQHAASPGPATEVLGEQATVVLEKHELPREPSPPTEALVAAPPRSETADDLSDAYGAAVGLGGHAYYVNRFVRSGGRPGVSWNWAAALFTSAWLVYRKMYLWAFAIYPVIFVSVLVLAWWAGGVAFAQAPLLQLAVMGGCFVMLSLVAGLLGNAIYARHVQAWLARTAALDLDTSERREWLRRNGGTNTVLATIWVAVVLTMVAASGWSVWNLLSAGR